MRARRLVIGLVLTGLLLGGSALPAKALLGIPTPPPPTPAQLQALATGLVPATPTIIVPTVDPQNPSLPFLPTVNVPPGLKPATGVLSPTTVITCQAASLGPLVGIVAMTAAFDAAGVEPPVKPGFLSPLFGPFLTACVAAPYATWSACGPDGDITAQLTGLPDLPAAGPAPSVDPFASVPAPFASLVNVLGGLQTAIKEYVYGGAPSLKFGDRVAKQLSCTSA